MTFEELDDRLRAHLEQLAFDAGCTWIEEFREERGRDPEPEECDEEAAATAENLRGETRRLLEAGGIRVDPSLLRSIQQALQREFVDALDV